MRSPDGLVARARRVWQRSPSRAGWGAALLIGPHLALGTWLLVVPDHRAFTAAQIVTLVHVGLALLTFPLAAVWVVLHVRKMRGAKSETTAASATSRILTAAAAVACVTGFVVLRGGDIATTAPLHAACGVAVGLPLALHLWLGGRRWAAGAALATLVLATGGSAAARRLLPPAPLEAEVPPFSFETRDASLFEPAENCGECHVQDYDDWKRSTHARTLELKNVREGLERAKGVLGEDLAHIGVMLADSNHSISQELVVGACQSCHAPAAFYGTAKESLLAPSGLVAEGTGCSFCHTLRQIRQNRDVALPKIEERTLSSADIRALVARTPFFVSAPETVRRYFFQGSRSALGRRVANWLIRWRPAVHARDYHSPVLDDSRACLPCHSLGIDSPGVPHMTYYGWEHSAFNTGDPKTEVACQDCHMVRHMTGQRVTDEEARMVPWGPSRKGARSHLFIGGNVLAAQTFHDDALARDEHALNEGSVSVAVSGAERVEDVVQVKVRVRSERVGHTFPALETQLRYGWVELKALDASGNVVAASPKPRDAQDFGCASPLIMASVDDPKPDNQRLVEPNGARDLVGRVTLPPGAKVARIVADLHQFVDPTPIATATFTPAAPL